MDNIDFILSLFNQFLFQDAKNNIEALKYYINTNPNTRGNKLVYELVSAIGTYTFESIDRPLFESILSRCNKTAAERNEILSKVLMWKSYDRNQIAPQSKYLKDVCAAAVINKANNMFANEPVEFIKYIKEANFTLSDADFFASKTFKEIDINAVIADSLTATVKTGNRWIDSLWPSFGGGVPYGQLIGICGSPGTGKSLLSMALAARIAASGTKTLYVALGDLSYGDFCTRIASTIFNVRFEEAYSKIADYYNQMAEVFGENLEISINSAGVVTADDIIEKVLRENFSVVFIDYDGNLGGNEASDNMYSNFGQIYTKLTKLSMAGKLCFICTQPKVNAYSELIEMQNVGESSRKVQTLDALITLSNVNPDCPNNVFVLSCAKNRRGRQGRTYVVRPQSYASFLEIPKAVYDQLRVVQEERDYSPNDIDAMIHQSNVNAYTQQNLMNQVQQNGNLANSYQGQFQPIPPQQPQQKFNGPCPF